MHNYIVNQCKFATSGFLANGSILEIRWLKVNLKRLFLRLFSVTEPLNPL